MFSHWGFGEGNFLLSFQNSFNPKFSFNEYDKYETRRFLEKTALDETTGNFEYLFIAASGT